MLPGLQVGNDYMNIALRGTDHINYFLGTGAYHFQYKRPRLKNRSGTFRQ